MKGERMKAEENFPNLSFWRDDLLDAMEERAATEMTGLPPGHSDRIVWASVGSAARTIREVRQWRAAVDELVVRVSKVRGSLAYDRLGDRREDWHNALDEALKAYWGTTHAQPNRSQSGDSE